MKELIGSQQVTPEIQKAFEHVKEKFPNVCMVIYDIEGRWFYMDEDMNAPRFANSGIDISILEDAADSLLCGLPALFQINNEDN